jgi:hypothetical protein
MDKKPTGTVKIETVQKLSGSWGFENPSTGTWTGGFKNRTDARAARAAVIAEAKERNEAPTNRPAGAGRAGTVEEPTEQKVVDSATAPEVSSSKDIVNVPAPGVNRMEITLTKTRTNKGGVALYAQPGVPANVKFPKSMFAEGVTAPDSLKITVEGDGVFALPGEVKVGGKKTSPENAEKIRANAEKAVARAKKAAERAEKAMAKAAKLAPADAPAQ